MKIVPLLEHLLIQTPALVQRHVFLARVGLSVLALHQQQFLQPHVPNARMEERPLLLVLRIWGLMLRNAVNVRILLLMESPLGRRNPGIRILIT